MLPQDTFEQGSVLKAFADLTLALFTWNSFRTTHVADNGHGFRAKFEAITTPDYWEVAGFTAVQSITEFAHLSPLENITANIYQGSSHTALTAYLQFLRLISDGSEMPPSLTSKKYAAQLEAGTRPNTKAKVAKNTDITSSKRLVHLRRILLLLKTVSLLSRIHHPCEQVELATATLSNVLADMVGECHETHQAGYNDCDTAATAALEGTAVELLVEMTVPVIKSRVTADPARLHAGDSCLKFLAHLPRNTQVLSQLGPLLVKQGEQRHTGATQFQVVTFAFHICPCSFC